MDVRHSKYAAQFGKMLLIQQVHVGVAEVHLESTVKVRIARTSVDFLDRMFLQGIDAAEAAKPFWVTADFPARPVVLSFDFGVLIFDRCSVRVPELIGKWKYRGATDATLVQQADQVVGGNAGRPR